jgi:hypothetical protein
MVPTFAYGGVAHTLARVLASFPQMHKLTKTLVMMDIIYKLQNSTFFIWTWANPTIQYLYVIFSFLMNSFSQVLFLMHAMPFTFHYSSLRKNHRPLGGDATSPPWATTSTCPVVWNLFLDWCGLFPNGPMFPSRVVILTPPPTLGIYLLRRFWQGVSNMFLDFGPTWSMMDPKKSWFGGSVWLHDWFPSPTVSGPNEHPIKLNTW